MVTVSLRCRRRGTVGFCDRASASPTLWTVSVFPAHQGHHGSIRPCDVPTRGRHGELARGVASPSPVPQTAFYSRCLWFFLPTRWPALGAQLEGPASPFGQGSWWCAFGQQSTRWASGTARDYRSAATKAKAASYGSNWKGLSLSTLFPCGRVNISCC